MDFNFDMVGPAIALGSGCVGSGIDCYIAGQASPRGDDKNRWKGVESSFVLSAAPASQSILWLSFNAIDGASDSAGTLSPVSAIAIGISYSAALVFSSCLRRKVCCGRYSSGSEEPKFLGKVVLRQWVCIESFSLFAFVFALLLMK